MAISEQDFYNRTVIGPGDELSKRLAANAAKTLRNSPYADIINEGMNGVIVFRLPNDKYGMIHSSGGSTNEEDPKKYGASLVDNLVRQSEKLDGEPVAFANVIDASSAATEQEQRAIMKASDGMVERANYHKVVIPNGELAILGNRVVVPFNISGTMLSILSSDSIQRYLGIRLNHSKMQSAMVNYDDIRYAIFDHQGKPLYMNSDGEGTKAEFEERARRYNLGLDNSFVMRKDDQMKLRVKSLASSDVIEMSGEIPFDEMESYAREIGRRYGLEYILQPERMEGRIKGYNDSSPAFNISGTSIGYIEEEFLKNPLVPRKGDYLVMVWGKSNPRSNGITDRRKVMIKLFGNDWHNDPRCKELLEFLVAPSILMAEPFDELLDLGFATYVSHPSGGAFKGKLARQLAKQGLYVKIDDLPEIDPRDRFLIDNMHETMSAAYSKFNMGVDGYFTTQSPHEAINVIEDHGLNAMVAGRLERKMNWPFIGRKTGVELTAYNGEKVYYSGKA